VEGTAEALNRMRPRLLSALRIIPIRGTELHDQAANGAFGQLTEWQAVHELRHVIERLDLEGTVFRANHSSNVVPLRGKAATGQGTPVGGTGRTAWLSRAGQGVARAIAYVAVGSAS